MTTAPMRIRIARIVYSTMALAMTGAIGRQAVSPRAIAEALAQIETPSGSLLPDAPQEHFGIMCLTTKHTIASVHFLSIGTLDASVVHPREVFRAAVLDAAAAIVLFHNHPSGDPDASPEDDSLTKRMIAAGVLMGIDVLDHVIVGQDYRYFSYREKGRL